MRVGSVVYDEKKTIIAVFTHGAWYTERETRGGHLEYEPMPHERAQEFEQLPDVLHLSMSHGELAIVEAIRQCVASFGGDGDAIVADVHRGVAEGLRKFGPFDPETETRDLQVRIRNSVRNALVYCGMHMLSGGNSRQMHEIVVRLARIWRQVSS